MTKWWPGNLACISSELRRIYIKLYFLISKTHAIGKYPILTSQSWLLWGLFARIQYAYVKLMPRETLFRNTFHLQTISMYFAFRCVWIYLSFGRLISDLYPEDFLKVLMVMQWHVSIYYLCACGLYLYQTISISVQSAQNMRLVPIKQCYSQFSMYIIFKNKMGILWNSISSTNSGI